VTHYTAQESSAPHKLWSGSGATEKDFQATLDFISMLSHYFKVVSSLDLQDHSPELGRKRDLRTHGDLKREKKKKVCINILIRNMPQDYPSYLTIPRAATRSKKSQTVLTMKKAEEVLEPETIEAPTMVIYNKKILTVEEWLNEISQSQEDQESQETPPTRPPSLDHKVAQRSSQEPLSFWQSLARVFRKGGLHRDAAKDEGTRSEN